MGENKMKATLLKKDQVVGHNKLDVFTKIDSKCAITDFAIVLGISVHDSHVDYDSSLKGRVSTYNLLNTDERGDILYINSNGDLFTRYACSRNGGITQV